MGLSLRDLGRGAGLSAGFLSQVERSEAFPSISSLVSIAKELAVDVSFFFEPPDHLQKVHRGDDLGYFSLDGLPVQYALLSGDLPNRKLEAMHVIIPSGYKSERWRHTYEGEEFLYIQRGQLSVTIGTKEWVLNTGDSIHFRSDARHLWRNKGLELVHVIWVGTPTLL